MRLGTLRFLACAALAMHAAAASAFFDVQVEAGKRWYEAGGDFDDQHVSAQEMSVAAHIDPIPLIPVAFGVSAAMDTLDKAAFDGGAGTTKTASGLEVGLDIMAWVPMVPIITPFARLKYPLMSKWAVEDESTDPTAGKIKTAYAYKVTGPQIGIGAKWSPLPILKLLVEAQMGMQKIEADEIEVGGVKVTPDISGDLKSNAFLLGLEIGL